MLLYFCVFFLTARQENGPYTINPDLTLKLNPNSWNEGDFLQFQL